MDEAGLKYTIYDELPAAFSARWSGPAPATCCCWPAARGWTMVPVSAWNRFTANCPTWSAKRFFARCKTGWPGLKPVAARIGGGF